MKSNHYCPRSLGDEALRHEVESLLRSDEEAESFFEASAVGLAAEVLMENQARSLLGRQLGQYRILSRLGAGGMGEVYLALDTRLGRRVAIKLLPAAFMTDAERVRRFEKEARAASALNHPNIITIHEIGEIADEHYLVTEYIDGETLRQRMLREPVSLSSVSEIAIQVASALQSAHAAGIVHRDIKPENVMVRPDGLIKVLDFGLAKLTEHRAEAIDTQAVTLAKASTEAGAVMGTAPYMSPEQARGQKVDARTDIFSLGVMLYEMLAGRRPFEGATMSDVIAAVLTQEPEPLSRHNKEVGPGLEQVILKCLAKERGQRFQTAGEFAAALKTAKQGGVTTGDGRRSIFRSRLVWLASAIAVLLIAAAAYWKMQPKAAPGPSIRSLAVLPLENLSGDPTQEYFSDGMTESLINNLAQIRALQVISRISVMRFKGSRKPLPEVAHDLNVDAVITGSVQSAGGRVKITAQLIQAATDTHLWVGEYDREMADVLKLQSEVARAVADEIRVQVTAEERARLAGARRINPEAHEAYLLGRYHGHKWNENDLRQAIEYFDRAIKIDPDYAAAWAGLSDAWRQRGIWGDKPFREVEAPSRNAALKAVKLNPNLAEAHIALSYVKNTYDTDWSGSEEEARRALELDPGNLDAHYAYGNLLMGLGRHDEAIREMQTAERLDPLSSGTQSTLGRVFYRARKYAEAEPHLKRAAELDPQNYGAYVRLGDLYEQMGRYPEAIANLEKSEAMRNGDRRLDYRARLARVYAVMGRRDEARRMLERIRATTEQDRLASINLAAAYAALGDKDEAFKMLFRLIDERNNLILFIKEDPPLNNLHSDPRWKEVLRSLNFPAV